ncbi:hypothetical protein [Thalassospira xiamenensis]|uniref:Uncharacterized protein n=1 Tax=Thalassospira xiamenensis TaxID=220697 RepID=A0A285TLZ1_9PROT|nr:hypothetical protein [Thalassospira xiamenensis]SOC21766.1 hypothetical protein SAMN05428964_103481 [Thalassospira xiamenensis]
MTLEELTGFWQDIPQLCPPPGIASWMMSPSDFARAEPGLHRGYRAADTNLLTPHSTGGIFIAQNAEYASSYNERVWRVLLDIRKPYVEHASRFTFVSDAYRQALPVGTDAIILPQGDMNIGRGPTIIALDASVIVSVEETWNYGQVLYAIKMGEINSIPDDVLADYPTILLRRAQMHEVYGETFPARQF